MDKKGIMQILKMEKKKEMDFIIIQVEMQNLGNI